MYYVATILVWNLQSGSHYQSASPLMYRRSPFMSRGGNKFSSTTGGAGTAEVTLPFNTSHHLNASHSDDSDEVESQNLLPHLMPRMSGRQRLNPGLATNAIIFCLLFVKDHWFGAYQWPLIGEGIVFIRSFHHFPINGFWALGGLSKLTRCHSRAINHALSVASRTLDKQGQRQVCHARCGVEVSGSSTNANLESVVFKKTFCFILILDCKKSLEQNWVSDQTWPNSRENLRELRTGSEGRGGGDLREPVGVQFSTARGFDCLHQPLLFWGKQATTHAIEEATGNSSSSPLCSGPWSAIFLATSSSR